MSFVLRTIFSHYISVRPAAFIPHHSCMTIVKAIISLASHSIEFIYNEMGKACYRAYYCLHVLNEANGCIHHNYRQVVPSYIVINHFTLRPKATYSQHITGDLSSRNLGKKCCFILIIQRDSLSKLYIQEVKRG